MVKINEFYDQPIDDSLPYNVVDDVCIFMRNDPMFYRKSFFPAIKRMQECSMSETEYDKIKELGNGKFKEIKELNDPEGVEVVLNMKDDSLNISAEIKVDTFKVSLEDNTFEKINEIFGEENYTLI